MFAPSLTPGSMILETYLRMVGVPYRTVPVQDIDSKGHDAYVMQNGIRISSSAPFLSHALRGVTNAVDLDLGLDDAAMSTSFFIDQCLRGKLIHIFSYYQWVRQPELAGLHLVGWPEPFGTILAKMRVNLKLGPRLASLGIASSSEDEIKQVCRVVCQSLSSILGDKKFFLHPSRPTSADAVVFGTLAPIFFGPFDSPIREYMLFQPSIMNLHVYLLRIRDMYWPDWNECCRASSG
ncbi:hypothetical protein H696_02733 [Fonticula alba]|uniref:Metaxin glutathione S-transferase domain-containing protein n=1 Tax=Fonticula alba TaxID=691883 RepID=A0A058ZA39_FONAL|nr:hypothetical protein H696_02733 [Fonticula alba]KCV70397.1 hypothetical protein H696_02733 [Fonticula alba]|eukprot:XP_009494913.1 hypothetical protein H696_02733 [Fonticula alba]